VLVLVPDASVLLKWALESDDEEDRDRAMDLKQAWLSGSCRVFLPTLWVYEVGNILGMKRPAAAKALLQGLLDLEIEEMSPNSYLDEIYRLMSEHKVTFYDAAYHGLAIHLNGIFLTADATYTRKTAAAGHVKRLHNWHGSHGETEGTS